MTDSPRSNRYHIAVFGRRNTGKSSLLNTLAGQNISIVSDVAGTTTDTVWKNIELPGIGAAVIGDTAGYDDEGILGEMRVESTRKSAKRIDMALIMLNEQKNSIQLEKKWREFFKKSDIPVLFLLNKCDDSVEENLLNAWKKDLGCDILPISAKTGYGIDLLLKKIADIYKEDDNIEDVTHSLAKKGDVVLLVMPQDAQAPKGRLIQPQVTTLRNLLDKRCLTLCCTPEDMPTMLSVLTSPPSLIITDSQVFAQVETMTPPESRLTSFSVLMARHKGDIETFRQGAEILKKLTPNSKILIAEACSHIPQNEDIGRVKLPRLIKNKIGDGISVDIVSGNDFPDDLTKYDLIIHCGACMFTRRHVLSRVRAAKAQNVPITNYGIAIAVLTGIYDRISY